MGCGFGVEGVEGGLEVLCELLKGFLSVGDIGICKLIVPYLGEIGSLPFAHFV